MTNMRQVLVDLFFRDPQFFGKIPGGHFPLFQETHHLLPYGWHALLSLMVFPDEETTLPEGHL